MVRAADVVHAHMIWNAPTLSSMYHAHAAGIPYVVAPHGSLEAWALGRRRHLKAAYGMVTEKPLLDRASAIHALSTVEADQSRDYGIRAPVAVLPNGVDLGSIDDERGQQPVSAPSWASRLTRWSISFWAAVPQEGPRPPHPCVRPVRGAFETKPRLVIAGHDAGSGYRQAMERLAAQSGAAARVTFVGEVRGARKVALLRSADVFVPSSTRKAFRWPCWRRWPADVPS